MSRAQTSGVTLWLTLVACLVLTAIPLPAMLQPVRPMWVTMAVIYWAMMWPRRAGVGTACLVGLLLDVLQGSLLGQHALALCLVAYLTLKFHLQIRIFPLWQLTLTVLVLLLVDVFVVFWVDGIAGFPTHGAGRWFQVLASTVLWPPVMAVFDRVRLRAETRSKSFA